MILPSQVDLILNCRGFYMSDYWIDEQSYSQETAFYKRFTNPNVKIVCLPQAFGPFDTIWSRKLVDYIYAVQCLSLQGIVLR